MIECFNCGMEYPPVATRWRCPACGMKDTCCDGAPSGRIPPENLERLRYSRTPKHNPVDGELDVD